MSQDVTYLTCPTLITDLLCQDHNYWAPGAFNMRPNNYSHKLILVPLERLRNNSENLMIHI